MSVSKKVLNALNIGVRIAAYVDENHRGEQQKGKAIEALKTEVRQQQYKLRKRTINAPGNSLCILFYFAFVSLLAARLPMIAISAAQFWHRMFMTYQTNIIWARQVSRWYNVIALCTGESWFRFKKLFVNKLSECMWATLRQLKCPTWKNTETVKSSQSPKAINKTRSLNDFSDSNVYAKWKFGG